MDVLRFAAAIACVSVLAACADETELQVNSIAPSSGVDDGGTVVVIHGENFVPGSFVRFGEAEATGVVVVDPATISATTPAHIPGIVDVVVETPQGKTATLPQGFTFLPDPPTNCVTTITPAFGVLDVDVVAGFTVVFNVPVAAESRESAFTLTAVGAEPSLPATVDVFSENEVQITPDASLAFFEDYALTVRGVRAAGTNDECPAQESVISTRDPEAEPRPLRPAAADAVAITGTTALVASATYRGFQVYDVSAPGAPQLLSDLTTHGTPLGLVIDGDRGYAPAGAYGVYVLDLSDPRSPSLAGVAGTPGHALDVAPFMFDGVRYLAVADGTGGLRILDVTEPEGAEDVAVVNPAGAGGEVVSVAIDASGVAVVGQLDDGFAVLDLSNPFTPVVLATRASESIADTFFGARAVTDVAIGDNTVFVALRSFGVQAFDITNPSTPVYLDHALGPQGLCSVNCPDFVQGLEYSSGSLFAASAMSGAARFSFAGGQIDLQATLPLSGRINDIQVAGGTLWVAAERGLASFEVAAADGATPVFAESSGWGLSQGILAKEGFLYVASSSRGLETYSLQDPVAPQLIDVSMTNGVEADVGLLNVHALGDLLVVADGRAGLSVFDLATPSSPALRGTIVGADGIISMIAGPTRVYACDGTYALWTVDLSNPDAPSYVSLDIVPEVGGCNGLAIRNDRLFMAGSYGLGIYDISTGDAVFEGAAILPAEDILLGVAIRDDYLYAPTYVRDHEGVYGAAQRLVVFDLSDPSAPVRVFKSEDLGGVTDISIRGDKLFLGGRGHGVWVWGLSTPAQPTLEGLIPVQGDAFRLTHSPDDAGILYVSARAGGIGVVRLGQLPED